MRHVVIDLQDSYLETERGCLMVRHPSWQRPQSIPLTQLETVVIQAKVNIKSSVISRLVQHGVRLQIIAGRGQGESGYLVGSWHNDAQRRLHQYAVCSNKAAQWTWAKRMVCLRLRSQRLMLLNAAKIRPELEPRLSYLANNIHGVQQRCQQQNYSFHNNINEMRGSEGAGSALYFQGYHQLFAAPLQFRTRNRRPPLDPVNVILSLSATLLHGIFLKAIQTVGLDPQLGMLHEISFGRDSLVCDLMELKRADMEWWVWRLFADEVLRVKDFSYSTAPNQLPCLLGKAGRGRFYAQFAAIQDNWLKDAQRICRLVVKRLEKSSVTLAN